MNFPSGPYLEVLEYLRQHPKGCTAKQIGEAFPHLDADTRGDITFQLRYEGYIELRFVNSLIAKWVAIK